MVLVPIKDALTTLYYPQIKDLTDQIGILNRQLETLKENNSTFNNDNQILAEKVDKLSVITDGSLVTLYQYR